MFDPPPPIAHNDNRPTVTVAGVRVVGHVGAGGRVTITDLAWRLTPPRPAVVAESRGDER